MPSTIKLAEYLFTRLKQLGISSIHGVPGDYNLTLLDYVEPSGLHWVGGANELNAAYAADGYARTNQGPTPNLPGLGAIITTFGVGELSAVNAIAGAFTERAGVVHIVGTPARASQDSRAMIHHTFKDGEYRRFGQISAQVTVAQTSLRDPRVAPEQIDHVLKQCLVHSRPVYIEVPVDLVDALVSAQPLDTPITLPEILPTSQMDEAITNVLEKLNSAKQPLILVDGEVRAFGIVEEVQSFVSKTNWPTFLAGFGKGLINESASNVHGVYRGDWADESIKSFFSSSDLVLCFGPHFSTTNTWGATSMPPVETTISFSATEITIGSTIYRDVPIHYTLSQILSKLDLSSTAAASTYSTSPTINTISSLSIDTLTKDEPIAHDKLWRVFPSAFLRQGDIVLAETGTAGYGAREMILPPHTRLFTPVTWLSIGYMLPATQGAALARRDLHASSRISSDKSSGRTILFIGDGSLQMTVQELSTIIRENLNVTIFVLNNDGYTIERCIHGKDQRYNDVGRWRYLEAPSFFGAKKDSFTASVKNWGELQEVLQKKELSDGEGLRMVEIMMGRDDAPAGPLLDMMNKQK